MKNDCDPIDFALNRKSEKLMAHPGIEPSSSGQQSQNSTPQLTRLYPELMIILNFSVFKAAFDKKAMNKDETVLT